MKQVKQVKFYSNKLRVNGAIEKYGLDQEITFDEIFESDFSIDEKMELLGYTE